MKNFVNLGESWSNLVHHENNLANPANSENLGSDNFFVDMPILWVKLRERKTSPLPERSRRARISALT